MYLSSCGVFHPVVNVIDGFINFTEWHFFREALVVFFDIVRVFFTYVELLIDVNFRSDVQVVRLFLGLKKKKCYFLWFSSFLAKNQMVKMPNFLLDIFLHQTLSSKTWWIIVITWVTLSISENLLLISVRFLGNPRTPLSSMADEVSWGIPSFSIANKSLTLNEDIITFPVFSALVSKV